MATAAPAVPRGRVSSQSQVPFAHKLVLNQWLLSLFNVTRFEDLAEHLRNEALEGLDENNVHHFHHALTAHLFNLTQLPTGLLLEYDQNIVRHTQRLNERRITHGEEPIVWKYFQYLTLLFTEIYLDRYFRDPNVVLSSFIISNTPAFRMVQQWGISQSEMAELNILFQDEDKDTYIETMLTRARS